MNTMFINGLVKCSQGGHGNPPLQNRCTNYCYRTRLEKTAQYAKENGYDSFSTTLLVSPYQKHDDIKRIGEELAEKYGLEFHYVDFRAGYREGQAKARELGLYMQKYCGCIFSEEERFCRKMTTEDQLIKGGNYETI